MPRDLRLSLRRYLTPSDFLQDLRALKAYRSSGGERMLADFERMGLLVPRVRLRWPDPVARRLWFEQRVYAQEMHGPLEPDGETWSSVLALRSAMFRWGARGEAGLHPFDDTNPAFEPFIQRDEAIVPVQDRRISVAHDDQHVLFDDCAVRDFYSGWQVLQAAELADMGLLIRANLDDKAVFVALDAAIHDGAPWPDVTVSTLCAPIEALREFQRHRAALDAVVWASEEANAALHRATPQAPAGRFRLTDAQLEAYNEGRKAAALEALVRHDIDAAAILGACRFMAGRWEEWDDLGRPLIAQAYKAYLAAAVRLLQLACDMTFQEIATAIGPCGRGSARTLDDIWPDWGAGQKARLLLTLRPVSEGPGALSAAEIAAFADFLIDQQQDAVFLRLESFERHAFDDVDMPLSGMRTDLQGLAVAAEQAMRAMGGDKGQLYEMFKAAWTGTAIDAPLKSADGLARQANRPGALAELRTMAASGPVGHLVADLVTAHRLRGGVHHGLTEDDQMELERLVVVVLRAIARTHAHLERSKGPAAIAAET